MRHFLCWQTIPYVYSDIVFTLKWICLGTPGIIKTYNNPEHNQSVTSQELKYQNQRIVHS